MHIWEVATWEIDAWEVALGKMPLGKYLIEKVLIEISPNIFKSKVTYFFYFLISVLNLVTSWK